MRLGNQISLEWVFCYLVVTENYYLKQHFVWQWYSELKLILNMGVTIVVHVHTNTLPTAPNMRAYVYGAKKIEIRYGAHCEINENLNVGISLGFGALTYSIRLRKIEILLIHEIH